MLRALALVDRGARLTAILGRAALKLRIQSKQRQDHAQLTAERVGNQTCNFDRLLVLAIALYGGEDLVESVSLEWLWGSRLEDRVVRVGAWRPVEDLVLELDQLDTLACSVDLDVVEVCLDPVGITFTRLGYHFLLRTALRVSLLSLRLCYFFTIL